MRKRIHKLVEHIIFSNLLVSLAVGVLTIGICNQLHFPSRYWYGLFVFSSTLLTYNFQRYIKSKQRIPHPTNHIIWVNKHQKALFCIILISSILSAYSCLELFLKNYLSLSLLLFSSTISFLYVNQLKTRDLREVPYLKIHLIALIWMIAVGGIELVNELDFSPRDWIFVAAHYLYILAITIPFDIRDLKYDIPKQKTIPQVIGITNAKSLSIIFMLLYLFLALLTCPNLQSNWLYISTIFLSIFLIHKVNQDRKEFYYSGILEGTILLTGLSLLV